MSNRPTLTHFVRNIHRAFTRAVGGFLDGALSDFRIKAQGR